MTRRAFAHVTGHEFRAKSQPTLLRQIASWLAAEEKARRLSPFMLGIQLDLREEDLDSKEPYRATVFVDGPATRKEETK